MRDKPYKIAERWLRHLFQLGREVTQTSLVLSMVLVLLLCLLTTPFQSALTESVAQHFNEYEFNRLPLAADQTNAPSKRVGLGASFRGPVGLQLYSLRNEFKRDGVPTTLQR